MKRITSALLLLISSFSFAQTYTLSADTFSVTVPFTDVQTDQFYVLGVDAELTNTTPDTVASNWIRNVQYLTSGWTTSLCDPEACWGDATNTENFNFLPNATSPVIVDFKPNQLSGYGVVKVTFRKQGNNFDNVEGTFIGRVDPGSGVSSVEKLQDIKLFPNPAKDKLIIATTTSMLPVSIEVFDVLGKKINATINKDGDNIFSVDVVNLKGGFYFLRMKLKNGSIVTRQFTKD